jgi:hypothetical protein
MEAENNKRRRNKMAYDVGVINNGLVPSGGSGRVYGPGLEKRMENQNARTAAGAADGSLDQRELSQINRQEGKYESTLHDFKSNDGVVGPRERAQLHSQLNRTSALIYADRHNEGTPGGENPLGEKESFDATITGDPHYSVDGSINGEDVSSTFDNQEVGTKTQYQGAGFKLDTTTVPWGDNGAAVVNSATVTTGFGKEADAVTVNADGTVSVNGEAVSLESGQSMDLNRTSSLTLNDDGSYTVSSRNGKVTNTFSAQENENGNYLNISSHVDDVQTVGWLQNQV